MASVTRIERIPTLPGRPVFHADPAARLQAPLTGIKCARRALRIEAPYHPSAIWPRCSLQCPFSPIPGSALGTCHREPSVAWVDSDSLGFPRAGRDAQDHPVAAAFGWVADCAATDAAKTSQVLRLPSSKHSEHARECCRAFPSLGPCNVQLV